MHMNKRILLAVCAAALGLVLILLAVQNSNPTDAAVSSADQSQQETSAGQSSRESDADQLPQQAAKEESAKKEESLQQEAARDQNTEHSEPGQTVTKKTQSETPPEDDGITYSPEGTELSPEQIDEINPGDKDRNRKQEQDHNDQQQTPGGDEQHSEIGNTGSRTDPQSQEIELPAIPIR